MPTPVLLEAELIKFLRQFFPDVAVGGAPDSRRGASQKLITVNASHAPLDNGNLRESIVDIHIYDKNTEVCLARAYKVIEWLDLGFASRTLPVSRFRLLTMPSIVRNTTSAQGASVVAFSFLTVGRTFEDGERLNEY